MELIVAIAALIVAVLALYLQFTSATEESKQKFIASLRRLGGSTGRVASYVLVLLVFLLSVAGIVGFWIHDEPIRRSEVIMVVFHILNALMYGYLTFSTPAKLFRKKQPADQVEA